jgi:hypothetical protein
VARLEAVDQTIDENLPAVLATRRSLKPPGAAIVGALDALSTDFRQIGETAASFLLAMAPLHPHTLSEELELPVSEELELPVEKRLKRGAAHRHPTNNVCGAISAADDALVDTMRRALRP